MASLEPYIAANCSFNKLPDTVKQSIGNSPSEYARHILDYSLSHQLRWKRNLVRRVIADEREYYTMLMDYSKKHRLLYPHHLTSTTAIKLRTSPFHYYREILANMISSDCSYDSLPNYAAADCLQVVGVGRNEYIDLMNASKTGKGMFRRRINPLTLLPSEPKPPAAAYWWTVGVAAVTKDEVKSLGPVQRHLVDQLIDEGPQQAGRFSKADLMDLYKKGLVWFHVPVSEEDKLTVPPLEGFVMNRTQGDYLEKLLYQIFVSLDENMSVTELADVLQIDVQQVRDALSIYCRLGFAQKKGFQSCPDTPQYHPSWRIGDAARAVSPGSSAGNTATKLADQMEQLVDESSEDQRSRIALVFDSTLTAFLMMGNLSPGMKKHAVTMFEAGKIAEEILPDFLGELDQAPSSREAGPSQECHVHANTLRDTIDYIRTCPTSFGMSNEEQQDENFSQLQMDLLRCESVNELDPDTYTRVLRRAYKQLISMAPLAPDAKSLVSSDPPHFGPAHPYFSSFWFKLWFYSQVQTGPVSLLIAAGTRLTALPEPLLPYRTVLVTTANHEPAMASVSSLLYTLNEALCHSPVLVQGLERVADAAPLRELRVPLMLPSEEFVERKLKNAGTTDQDSTADAQDASTNHDARKRVPRVLRYFSQHPDAWKSWLDTKRTLTTPLSDALNSASSCLPVGLCPGYVSIFVPSKTSEDSGDNDGGESVDEASATLQDDASSGDSEEQPSSDEHGETHKLIIYGVTFGLPLFSEADNITALCAMEERQVFSDDNISLLTQSQQKATSTLLHFIMEHSDMDDPGSPDVLKASELPFPTHTLLFDGQQLCRYDCDSGDTQPVSTSFDKLEAAEASSSSLQQQSPVVSDDAGQTSSA